MKTVYVTLMALISSSALADLRIDGSSTVYPITQAVAEEFRIDNPDVKITVAFSGTGGGFKKFCRGEIDVVNASRPIKKEEMDECKKSKIEFVELPVAFDGLTVVVHPSNTFAKCLKVAELKKAWMGNSTVKNWSDIRAGFPARKVSFYGAGSDSGTFDYFTEAVTGKAGNIRKDYFPSEDDNILVKGIEGSKDSIGFFGFAYYLEEGQKLKAVAIDNGKGCVLPTAQTINNGTYAPLSRPLFVYASVTMLNSKKDLQEFLKFYLSKDARKPIQGTGFVVLPEKAYQIGQKHVDERRSGSIFATLEPGVSLLKVMEEFSKK